MHEVSLVHGIFDILEDMFSQDELDTMTAIDLKVGKLSNVEPILMQNAFDAVTASKEKYQEVELNMIIVPVEIHCEICKKPSEIEDYIFICSFCGAPNNNVVKGMELHIHQVHFDD